jgi:hypothetical protein
MATVRHPTLGLVRTVDDPAAWIQQGWLPVDPAPDPTRDALVTFARDVKTVTLRSRFRSYFRLTD